MYLPYLRGRQFELIALRELVERKLICDKVIPIVEPVKLSSTLINTIKAYADNKSLLCVITNPQFGSFNDDMKNAKKDSNESKLKKNFEELMNNRSVIHSAIMNDEIELLLRDKNASDWVIINNNSSMLDLYESIFSTDTPKYTLIPDKKSFHRRVVGSKVLLDDKFEKQTRNKDYALHIDEFFSEDHIEYLDDFQGFSDYSIIGNEYVEGGFAPLAVAIHIVYFKQNKSLWIRHFVSDSNDGIEDPGGKFYEAVSKLSRWVEDNNITKTYGLKVLLEHQKKQTYPGLGSVKKLSIMHHLELMSQYLSENS